MQADQREVKLALLVDPARVASYARANGWVPIPSRCDDVHVFGRPANEDRFDQLVVPRSSRASDYDQYIRDVVYRIAEFEKRPAMSVLNELLLPPSDILRYRLADRTTEDGTVPFEQGLELLKGVERSLRAAACSVVEKLKYFPRLARAESDKLLEAARMGQTERGSYIALVYLPLSAVLRVDENPGQTYIPTVDEPEPFVRQTTRHLMVAVDHITKCIAAGRPEQVEEPTEDGVQVSANLCDALLEMQPTGSQSSLQITAKLDSTVQPRVSGPLNVEIPAGQFDEIGRLASYLRPVNVPTRTVFVGTVSALMGQPNSVGEMQGRITLHFQHEDELLRGHVSLSAADYQIAVEAHRQNRFVTLQGFLHRRARMHVIEDYAHMWVLPRD